MKTLRLLRLLGLAVCALPAAQPADRSTDLARLQGEWSMVSGVADGFPVPEPMRKNSKRICEGNVTIAIIGGQLLFKARFTLDPAKTPKTIDYEMLEGVTTGKTQLGIYAFDGDTVKFCFGEPGAARPLEFASKSGDRRTSSVWKRVTAAAEKK